MHLIDFPGTLKLCGHHREQWVEKGTELFHRKKSQLTSASFCIFFPLTPIAKKKKKKKKKKRRVR